MTLTLRRARLAELDARVEAAAGEKLLSRHRLAHFREHVTGPLHEKGQRNQFAEIIRKSLLEGHHR
ncbi:MAG TPA: hypothetical protein VIX86_20600 [Streptosporangiaceae bacterium]